MELSQFFELLDEQVVVKFTGRINVLDQITNQHFGHIFIQEGEFVHITYRQHMGQKAFYYLSFDLDEKKRLKIVIEPELLGEVQRNLHYPYAQLKSKVAEALQRFRISKKGRPPEHIKLMLMPEFIHKGTEISSTEFDTMCVVSDFNLVRDIYENTNLLDFEVTDALVSLRQKGAIKVIKP
ncbi:MAG: hypothetical protein JNM93_03210 [Bacteriovoracaceae bacterium]|nr:hypothetical protein [Bacteriovoracaceae bacterium]